MTAGLDQPFLRTDGFPIDRINANLADHEVLLPDHFSALRFLIAIEGSDVDTIHEILRERPALPLLSGMTSLARAFGKRIAGDGFRNEMDLMALNEELDPLGAADAYRTRSQRA